MASIIGCVNAPPIEAADMSEKHTEFIAREACEGYIEASCFYASDPERSYFCVAFNNEDLMDDWLTAHPDVVRTDFKRKLRYPAVDRRTVVKEPVLVEVNKLNQRLSARAYPWLLRVARLYNPYENALRVPQHLLRCDKYLVECDQCIKEAGAYLKARRQSVDQYLNQ
jgi:hypothetical protein